MAKKLAPMHPGEVLREEFLLPLGLSPGALAKACGIPRTRIERLSNEATGVTADTRTAPFEGVRHLARTLVEPADRLRHPDCKATDRQGSGENRTYLDKSGVAGPRVSDCSTTMRSPIGLHRRDTLPRPLTPLLKRPSTIARAVPALTTSINNPSTRAPTILTISCGRIAVDAFAFEFMGLAMIALCLVVLALPSGRRPSRKIRYE